MGSNLNNVVSWVNIMMYDVMPQYLNAPTGFNLGTYEQIFRTFDSYVAKNKVVMGFEPGY